MFQNIIGEHLDPWELAIILGWGLTVIIVLFHASYTGQNMFAWGIIALVLPGLGMILYFLFGIMYGVEKTKRRSIVQKEQHWEFLLTDKGKPVDPNAPPEEEKEYKAPHGHSKKLIDESPLSQENVKIIEPEPEEPFDKHGELPNLIDKSPLSREVDDEGK